MPSLIVSTAFERLSQAMRVLLEAHMRHYDLIQVDRQEALGNLDVGFTGVLNAFHNLYDALNSLPQRLVDWYAVSELCMILAIRNARHHNVSNGIRGLFDYHCANYTPTSKRRYLLIHFVPREVGAGGMEYYISWKDFRSLLDDPNARLRAPIKPLLLAYVNASAIEAAIASNSIPEEDVFFNAIPLIVNAGIAIRPHLTGLVDARSTEAKHFLFHFEVCEPSDTHSHEVKVINLALPE